MKSFYSSDLKKFGNCLIRFPEAAAGLPQWADSTINVVDISPLLISKCSDFLSGPDTVYTVEQISILLGEPTTAKQLGEALATALRNAQLPLGSPEKLAILAATLTTLLDSQDPLMILDSLLAHQGNLYLALPPDHLARVLGTSLVQWELIASWTSAPGAQQASQLQQHQRQLQFSAHEAAVPRPS